MAYLIEREQVVAAPPERVFAFFSDAHNLEAITPPWLRFRVLSPAPIEMREGTLIEYRLRLHGLTLSWISLIEEWQEGRRFVDRQLHGPYRSWRHTHDFRPHAHGTLVRDEVRYELPLGPLAPLLQAALVRRDLARIFDHRRERVAALLGAQPRVAVR